MNSAPADFNAAKDLPAHPFEFPTPLYRQFTQRQQQLATNRKEVLVKAHRCSLPGYLPASPATTSDWHVELPDWCQDQRNQMTEPSEEADLVVKMLNSGVPGVMLDLEDSLANAWEHLILGIENILKAVRGDLGYFGASGPR